ncbi:MAG: hypothetical protein HQK77_13795 [Desulfobacterales bacterium]|nr:hypothetical protein [Desulfobacterales bacterium]
MNQINTEPEKYLLNEDLQYAQRMETLGTLAGGIAHDFNNILAGMLGYLELLKHKCTCGQTSREIKKIEQACEQMASIVRQMLNFTHRNIGLSLINISELIKETLIVIRHTIPKGIEIETLIPDESLIIKGNSGVLQQALLNICYNAVEAMPNGGKLTIHLKKVFIVNDQPPPFEKGTYILVEVSDTGIGIKPEIRNRIFEPFFTTKPLDVKRGTGLGLTVVWHNIKSHNGHISVLSKPNKGTTFRVYLPIYRENGKIQDLKQE